MADADVIEALHDEIPLARIHGPQAIVIVPAEAQARHSRFLQRAGRTDGQVDVELLDGIRQSRRGENIAQAPARDGIRLGQGTAAERPFIHAGQGRKIRILRRFIDDVFIDLIDDDEGVVLFDQLGNGHQLFPGEYLAARIGRITEENRFRMLFESRFQFIGIKGIVRFAERYVDRLCPAEQGVCTVGFIERRKEDDFIARVDEGHHSRHEGFRPAAGDDDFPFRVDSLAREHAAAVGHGLAQIGCAIIHAVLVRSGLSYFAEAVAHGLRRRKVREAFGQIDGAAGFGHFRHAGNDGISE